MTKADLYYALVEALSINNDDQDLITVEKVVKYLCDYFDSVDLAEFIEFINDEKQN